MVQAEPTPVGRITGTGQHGCGTESHSPLEPAPAQPGPAFPSSTSPSHAPQSSGEYPCGHGELILVVDDDPTVRFLATSVLQKCGYRVIAGENGAEGIALYVQRRSEIALVITDMMMPVIDGPAMASTLLRIDPAIRILVASGCNTTNDRRRFTMHGIGDFLPKPYSASALAQKVNAMLTGRLQGAKSEAR